MEYKFKNSTHLKWMEFDEENQELLVEFMTGGKYLYENVTKAIVERIIKCDSFSMGGEEFIAIIRSHPKDFPYKKIS